jgi:hypothetical protein
MKNPLDFLQEKKKINESIVVVHNTNIKSLIKSLTSYSGLLAPSLAIINPDNIFKEFGDVSVLFKSETLFNGEEKINHSDRTNYVYNMDSYSARFPEILFDVNKNYSISLYKELDKIAQLTDSDFSYWDHYIKKGKQETNLYLSDLSAFKLKFIRELIDENYIPNVFKVKKKNSSSYANTKSISKFLEKELFLPKNRTENNLSILKKLLKNEKELYVSKLRERLDISTLIQVKISITSRIEKAENEFSSLFDENTTTGLSSNYESQLNRDQMFVSSGSNYKFDYKRNSKILDSFIKKHKLENKFKEFCEKYSDKLHFNPHIKIGKKKLEPTEDNILNCMRKEGALTAEKTLTMGLAKSRTLSAKRIMSTESLWNKRDNLFSIDHIKEISDSNQAIFFELCNETKHLSPDYIDGFDHLDLSSQLCGENHTNSKSFESSFKRKGYKDFPSDVLERFYEFSQLHKIENVHYFEAKPFRKIDIKEIEAVVLPRNTPKGLKDELTNLGIKVIKNYTSKNYQNRMDVIKNIKSVQINPCSIDKNKNKNKNKNKKRI